MMLVLLFLLGTYLLSRLKTPGLNRFDVIAGWWIKLAASATFVWVYTYFYGKGTLSADPGQFMYESKMLAQVADHSWVNYLRFLFGLETQEMIEFYMSQTSHWSVGDLTLINDSGNVIRVNSVLHLFSGGDISIHLLIISFFSLLGFREVYLAFYDKTPADKRLIWLLLIAMPSVLFWTGSMLKEPMLMIGFCMLLRAVFGELSFRKRLIRIVFGTLLMLLFKPYVLGCFIPAVLIYWLANHVFRGSWMKAFLAVVAVCALVIYLIPEKRQRAVEYLTRKQYDFINVGQGGMHVYADSCFFFFRPDQVGSLKWVRNPIVVLKEPVLAKQVVTGKARPFKDVWLKPDGSEWIRVYYSHGCESYIEITYINDSFGQLLKNSPEAFVNAAFRPFIGDPGRNLIYFAMIETILLFGWLLWQARQWRLVPPETRRIVGTLVLFSVLLFILIGWITPVLGAIVRYRIPAYFALLITGILLFRKPKEREAAFEEKTSS